MFIVRVLVTICVLTLNVAWANADTFQDFDISGTYHTLDGDHSFSGGGLSVDVTTNTINSLNLAGVPGVSIFAVTPFSNLSLNLAGLVIDHGVNENVEANIFLTPAGNGFYSGGILTASGFGPPGSVGSQCPTHPTLCDDAAIGFTATLTPDPALTPLPAALPLFATGLSVLGLLGWRRTRKNAAAIAGN